MRTILFHSLQRELRKKPIDLITVSEILKGSGISRSTFYRHFNDKYDFLNQCYQDMLDATCEKYHEGMSWKDSMNAMYGLIASDILFFQNAIHSNDVNALGNYIRAYGIKFHNEHLNRCGVDIENWETKMLIRAIIFGSTDIMLDWIRRGAVEPVADMVRIFKEALPARFSQYYPE